ncbi:MAG: ftsH1 [Pedosphaera sp.]|nr:ftsH1 [Pedosphaera sp.]
MTPEKPPPIEKTKKFPPQWSSVLWYLPIMIFFLWMWQETFSNLNVRTIPYSEFKTRVRQGEVAEATVRNDTVEGKIQPRGAAPAGQPEAANTNAATNEADKSFLFRTVRVEDPKLVEDLEAAHVKFVGMRPGFLSQFLVAWLLPIGLMFLLWGFISRRMAGGGTGQSILSFGKSRARLVAEKETGITFNDVAGCDEAKYELQEVVDFLKNPDRYRSLGAKIPKGVLLVGPPGTGKTLLAKAVAGEAHVPFFSISGSDFVEMFVGVGAARVRDLFVQAKAQAPCIVFIDELDAIGRERGVHVGPVNDEREQTLNALLVEMDGFAPNAGVILLAATNRPEVLDRALLRPGRFDRQVIVDAPDIDGRQAILRVHTRLVPMGEDVDLRRIARATPGFSGADLANAVNEAALLAARRHARMIGQRDLEEAIEKVVAGPERRSRRLTEEIKRRVAYHEVGHALVASYSKHADPVQKISIIPRGRAALGYTMQLPAEDQFLMTRSELVDRIRGALGGRAAEEVVYGEVTTGAENDLERVTALARQMICLFGMNEKLGLAHSAQRPAGAYIHAGDGAFQRDCSEKTAEEIDEEVKKMLDCTYSEAREILLQHREQLEAVTAELLKRETLDGRTFRALIGLEPEEEPAKPLPIPAEVLTNH